MSVLKGLSKGVEETRKTVKQPYLEAGKAIDAKAKEYVTDIDKRTEEIERMIGEFQRKEREKAEAIRREEERKRQEAEAALRREQEKAAQAERDRIAKEKAAQEAEARRIQAEIDAAEAKTAAEKRKAAAAQAKAEQEAASARAAQEEAERASQQAEIDAAEARDTAAEANATTVIAEPPRAAGAAIREVVEFEVTDIEAFYAWDAERRREARKLNRTLPTFVKMEVKRRDFLEYINMMDATSLASIPGITFTKFTRAAVRSVPASLALNQ